MCFRVIRFWVRQQWKGVRKWKFEPTILNGQAVELESEVKIGFS
jgi:hypothetical protein